jgi:hypothetical protein
MMRRAVIALLGIVCAAGAIWTAYWCLRYGLTPRPPLSTLQTVIRFTAVAAAIVLWQFRRDALERTTLACMAIAAGASALFGLGVRSEANDVARLLFHFIAYALGVVVCARWLRPVTRASSESSKRPA